MPQMQNENVNPPGPCSAAKPSAPGHPHGLLTPTLFTVLGLQHPGPKNTLHSDLAHSYPGLQEGEGAECICMSTPPHHFCLGPNTCFPFKVTSERNICTFSINILTGRSVNLCRPSWEARWKRGGPTPAKSRSTRGGHEGYRVK